MITHKLYRIEDKDTGKGFYRNYKYYNFSFRNQMWLDHLDHKKRNLLQPHLDKYLEINQDDFTAFLSKNLIKKHMKKSWVKEMIEKFNFEIQELEVSDCKKGNIQAIFKKQNIINKKIINLSEIFR